MSKILKISLICALFTISYLAHSQTFGLRLGLNLANQADKNDYIDFSKELNYKMIPGIHAGLVVDFPLVGNYSLESGLFFDTKGHKRNETYAADELIQSTYLLYANIPFHLKYHFTWKKFKFYGFGGIYTAYGFWGKRFSKMKIAGETNRETYDYNWGDDILSDDFRHFDYGLEIGTGMVYNTITFQVNYGFGLNNISPYTGSGVSIKNRVLSISVGLNLGKKGKLLFPEFKKK